MAKLIGDKPNQVPTNADLGDLAYVDMDNIPTVNVDNGTLVVDAATSRVGIGTSSPAAPLEVNGVGSPTTRTAIIRSSGVVGIHLQSESNFSRNILFQDNNGDQNSRIFALGTLAGEDAQLRLDAGTFFRVDTNGAQRMRIDPSGNVGIGTSSPTSELSVVGAGGFTRGVNLGTAGVDATAYISQFRSTVETIMGPLTTRMLFGTVSNHDVAFLTNDTETMRITSTGNVGIGTSSPSQELDIIGRVRAAQGFFAGNSNSLGSSNTTTRFIVADAQSNTRLWLATDTSQPAFFMHRPDTTGEMFRFVQGDPPTVVGNISVTTTATSYNTSSDYRLKEDVQPMVDASYRVLALRPVNFAWKINGSRVDGFIAHEAQAIVPEAVHGTKDEVDAEGDPVYQGIDQSKLVPLLTAALQDALKRIEALEAQLNP